MELARVGRIKEKGRGKGRHIQQGQGMVRSGRTGDAGAGIGMKRRTEAWVNNKLERLFFVAEHEELLDSLMAGHQAGKPAD